MNYISRCLVTKAWSNGGALRALVFALAGSNPAPDKTSLCDTIFLMSLTYVLMAQWIERPTSNRKAAGSSPAKDYIALM